MSDTEPTLTPPSGTPVDDVTDHTARIEYLERAEYEARHEPLRRNDKRLLVAYIVMVIAFALSLYRTEVNDHNLKDGLYDACVARNDQSASINQVRQVFITRISQGAGGQTPEGQVAIQQLQAFLNPLEDCGTDPRA